MGEFAQLFKRRPFAQNIGGMTANHVFAVWFTLRALQPPVVVESGVFRGQGTWLIRQVVPAARVFSIDPRMPPDAWRDDSGLTTYINGSSYADFGDVTWQTLVPKRAKRARGLVILDDHMSSVRRVVQAIEAGFGHLWYEDNWKYASRSARSSIGADCYSFSAVCSAPAEPSPRRGGAGVPYRDYFGGVQTLISSDEHAANLRFLRAHLITYFEFPALYDACNDPQTPSGKTPHAQRAPRALSALLHSRAAAVSLFGDAKGQLDPTAWSSFYPPYVQLAARIDPILLRGTTPWRLGSVNSSTIAE